MKNLLTLALSSLVLTGFLSTARSAPNKPNVLCIAVDDLNHWVGYLGRIQADDHAESRPIGGTRRLVHAQLLRGAGVQSQPGPLMSGLRPGASGVYDNSENFQP